MIIDGTFHGAVFSGVTFEDINDRTIENSEINIGTEKDPVFLRGRDVIKWIENGGARIDNSTDKCYTEYRTFKSRKKDASDIHLYYTEKGEGEPLVLLHGNGENGDYFVHQLEYFSKRRRVIAVDTRGHGKSPRGDRPFTIAQFAEDLLNFLNEHCFEKPDILGFSDGANIALTFALKYPERVSRLILNGGNLSPDGVKRRIQIPIEVGYKIASKFAEKSPEAKKNAELLGLMVNEPNISPDELSAVTAKTLVIAGTCDMIKDSHTELIGKSIPNSRTVRIWGDHFIANKNPEEFNRAVEEFLDEK
ncbi:MAG: alpha/beta hydrolase [Oscillospiraceae bacterium]|nr:alpha/beta hydrolase [Oscillospiraceae bacterium]